MKNRYHTILSFILFYAGYSTAQDSTIIYIPFDQSMKLTKGYTPSLIKKNSDWRRAQEIFESCIRNQTSAQTQLRIPKIIHQIWLGSPLPQKYKAFAQTWMKYHPDWQYILWTDQMVKKIRLINQQLFDQTKNLGEKSDILRYEILEQMGGLYVDTDFECLKPFDVFHYQLDFYSGLEFGPRFRLLNGLIGTCAHHPIIKECVRALSQHTRKTKKPTDIIACTGPTFFTNCYRNAIEQSPLSVVFPVGYFYPWPYKQRKNTAVFEIQSWLQPESYAIHHWHMSWNSKQKRTVTTKNPVKSTWQKTHKHTE